MNKLSKSVFFHKMTEKINAGEYDQYLTIPFMSRELLIKVLKRRIDKMMEEGKPGVLDEAGVDSCVRSAKELAATMFALYVKLGFIERTETGYSPTEKGKIAVKQGIMNAIFNDV